MKSRKIFDRKSRWVIEIIFYCSSMRTILWFRMNNWIKWKNCEFPINHDYIGKLNLKYEGLTKFRLWSFRTSKADIVATSFFFHRRETDNFRQLFAKLSPCTHNSLFSFPPSALHPSSSEYGQENEKTAPGTE